MFSTIISIIFTVGVISAENELDSQQFSYAYEVAFQCTKTAWDADNYVLEAEGRDATDAEILEAGCEYSRAFTWCIAELNPAVFSTKVPNIVHFLIAFEWQSMVIAERAGMCHNQPKHVLKKIALESGILKEENLQNIEEDDYEPCAGEVVRKCVLAVESRMKEHLEPNFLRAIRYYLECYVEEASTCTAPILQHFVAFVKAYEKHLSAHEGNYAKKVEKIKIPRP